MPLFAAAAGGAVALSALTLRAREPAPALLLVAVLAAFAAVALLKVQSMRYLLPLYPLLALLAAWFVLQLAQRRRAVRWGAENTEPSVRGGLRYSGACERIFPFDLLRSAGRGVDV